MIDLGGLESLATTEVNIAGMLTLILLIGALGAFLWIWKKPTVKAEDTRQAESEKTMRVVLEMFTDILATKLSDIVKSVKHDQVETAAAHSNIFDSLNKHALIMERIAVLITDASTETQDNRVLIGKVKEVVTQVDKVVNTMNTDMGAILTELVALRKDIQELRETVLSKTEYYESRIENLENGIIEAIPKPKPPGVPVTPKPVNDEPIKQIKEAQLKAEKGKTDEL